MKSNIRKMELSEDDLAAQAMIFFFGGFETTSSVMRFMIVELGVNPNIQKKLREEIDEVLKSCEGNLTYEVVMKMKYLNQVISGK